MKDFNVKAEIQQTIETKQQKIATGKDPVLSKFNNKIIVIIVTVLFIVAVIPI